MSGWEMDTQGFLFPLGSSVMPHIGVGTALSIPASPKLQDKAMLALLSRLFHALCQSAAQFSHPIQVHPPQAPFPAAPAPSITHIQLRMNNREANSIWEHLGHGEIPVPGAWIIVTAPLLAQRHLLGTS